MKTKIRELVRFLHLLSTIPDVRRIAVDLLRLHDLVAGANTDNLPVLHHDLVHGLVQHVRSAVDCAQTEQQIEKKKHKTKFIRRARFF